jgi:glycosyltransferase involved in cell wall biosynthesis
MNIGILGCRGIPNRYGGFEQFAEDLAPGLVQKGMTVSVYCSHHHPYTENEYKGVHLIRCYDPEPQIGATGQIIYDLNCILDSRKRKFDIIYQLGYTSAGLWQWLIPTHAIVVSNMDGIEWKRAKYGNLAKRFLTFSELKVAQRSDLLIGDAVPIQEYLASRFNKPVSFLAYSATPFSNPSKDVPARFNLMAKQYMLVIARMQEDNHIEMIIEGYLLSGSLLPLCIIGNTNNKYGLYLKNKYKQQPNVNFMGGIFNQEDLNNLRYHAGLYFHGHSAGGTNPSLLEAMAASSRICAHDNVFNRSVLESGALFFKSADDIAKLIMHHIFDQEWESRVARNLDRIVVEYGKDKLIGDYFDLFKRILTKSK